MQIKYILYCKTTGRIFKEGETSQAALDGKKGLSEDKDVRVLTPREINTLKIGRLATDYYVDVNNTAYDELHILPRPPMRCRIESTQVLVGESVVLTELVYGSHITLGGTNYFNRESTTLYCPIPVKGQHILIIKRFPYRTVRFKIIANTSEDDNKAKVVSYLTTQSIFKNIRKARFEAIDQAIDNLDAAGQRRLLKDLAIYVYFDMHRNGWIKL